MSLISRSGLLRQLATSGARYLSICASRHQRPYTTAAASASTSRAGRKTSEPLRILFCGSDDFSCESLRALHAEKVSNGGVVQSVEVMVREAKRTGRGKKILQEVPCKMLAQELGITIHQRDTLRGFSLPKGINLIIAVSYGLFIPSRLLKSAQYGGLNVHPSTLPHLRGPAPIHHALMRGDSRIGVSVQTLDDKAFDHGTVLAQTVPPGFPISPQATLQDMTAMLAKEGAKLLVQSLRDGLHLPPHEQVPWFPAVEGKQEELVHAPKVTKADSEMRWDTWTHEDFTRRARVFQWLWTAVRAEDGSPRRVLVQEPEVLPRSTSTDGQHQADGDMGIQRKTKRRVIKSTLPFMMEPGEVFTGEVQLDERSGTVDVSLRDGTVLRLRTVKIAGQPEKMAAVALKPFLAGS